MRVPFYAHIPIKGGFFVGENNYLGWERVGRLLLDFAFPSTLALMIFCLRNIVDRILPALGAFLSGAVIVAVCRALGTARSTPWAPPRPPSPRIAAF